MPGVWGLAGLAGEAVGPGRCHPVVVRLFAGANWSRWRNGHPNAAVLGSSPKGRRSGRPACDAPGDRSPADRHAPHRAAAWLRV